MFAALNIDRNNIQNAVSDNMLDDLGITRGDYVRKLISPAIVLLRSQILTIDRILDKRSQEWAF